MDSEVLEAEVLAEVVPAEAGKLQLLLAMIITSSAFIFVHTKQRKNSGLNQLSTCYFL